MHSCKLWGWWLGYFQVLEGSLMLCNLSRKISRVMLSLIWSWELQNVYLYLMNKRSFHQKLLKAFKLSELNLWYVGASYKHKLKSKKWTPCFVIVQCFKSNQKLQVLMSISCPYKFWSLKASRLSIYNERSFSNRTAATTLYSTPQQNSAWTLKF